MLVDFAEAQPVSAPANLSALVALRCRMLDIRSGLRQGIVVLSKPSAPTLVGRVLVQIRDEIQFGWAPRFD
jgi:hypothetical protein